jgi:hypothetical protein
MRLIVAFLVLLSALLLAAQIEGFSAKPIRTDSKSKKLSQIEHQHISRNDKTGPEAHHHTYREEFPGKHKESAWFQRPAHKKKSDRKVVEKASGREWTYGKVPRF